MKPYLRRLLALLEATARQARPRPMDRETYVRLDELLGVPAELFPPAVRLSPRHAARLVRALLAALAAFRVYADLPATLPAQRRYALLVARLGGAEIAYYGLAGTWVEFCTYEPAYCLLPPEYCACRSLVEEAVNPYPVRSATTPTADVLHLSVN